MSKNTDNIISTSIIANIRSKRYFEDAREWYCFKYLGLYRQSVFLFIFNVFAIASFGVMIFNIYVLLPITDSQVFVSTTNSSLHKVPVLKPLQSNDKYDVEKTIAKYLITYYIQARESYNYSDLEKQQNVVNNLSSQIVALEYKNNIDTWNNNNKEFIYKTSKTAVATVENIIFTPYDNFLDSAQVIYKVTIQSKKEVLEQQKWQAKIKFYIPIIEDVLAKRTNFNFSVTNYETQRLQ